MIDAVLVSIGQFAKIHLGSKNDDWVDRLNHVITVLILILFVLFVTAAEFVGDPIHCWCPAEFEDSWVDYTHAVCWVSNTYYIPFSSTIPRNIHDRRSKELRYYQWVPVILMVMALLFKLPNILWRIFNDMSGVNLNKIVDMASSTQVGSRADRHEAINHIAAYMDRWLTSHQQYRFNFMIAIRQRISKICFFFCNKNEGTYITGFYLFVKFAYLANVFGQFFFLNQVLAMDFLRFGQNVIGHLTDSRFTQSPQFPRETLCDFTIRQQTNIHRYTVHCVLTINLFNEKIFAFLWFWMVLVATATSASLLFWFYRVFFRQNRKRFVKRHMLLTNKEPSGLKDKNLTQKFANHYLRDDGIFVLRIIGKNSTDLVVCDLLKIMWKNFRKANADPGLANSISHIDSDPESVSEDDE